MQSKNNNLVVFKMDYNQNYRYLKIPTRGENNNIIHIT